MENMLLYMTSFFMVFFACAVVCFCLRFVFWIYTEYWARNQRGRHSDDRYMPRQRTDRQGNNCSQNNGTGRDNRYDDIFFIEPNSREAARIRERLEKDDKDLPTYDEVMRIAGLNSPKSVPARNNHMPAMTNALTMSGASGSNINTTNSIPSVPPYRATESVVISLTPPPYTPTASSIVVPITTPLQFLHNTHST